MESVAVNLCSYTPIKNDKVKVVRFTISKHYMQLECSTARSDNTSF